MLTRITVRMNTCPYWTLALLSRGVNLRTRSSFADTGATITHNFGLEPPVIGISFLNDVTQLTR
jgi:phosphopentomutase